MLTSTPTQAARAPRRPAGHLPGPGDRRVGSRLAQRRDPLDRPGHPRQPDPAVLGDRRLRARLRRAAAAGRRDRRPLRPAPGAAGRPRPLRRRLDRRDDGQRPGLADRHARRARCRARRWSCRPPCPRSPAPSRPSSGRAPSAPGPASPAPARSSACSPPASLLEVVVLARGVRAERRRWPWPRSSARCASSRSPPTPRRRKLDLVGALITVAGLGTLVYSIIEAPTRGLGQRPHAGAASRPGWPLLGAFIAWELRHPAPLLDPRLFRHRAFAAGTLSITLQFFAFFGFVFLVMQYLQLVRGHSPLVSALSLVPMALAMMPAARVAAPRLAAHAGALRACLLGLLLITAGLLVMSRLDADSSYWLLLAGLLPLGAGMGLAMTPATAAITDALPVAKQGVGSAMNDLARELGGALGHRRTGQPAAVHLPQPPGPGRRSRTRWPSRLARRSRSLRASVPRSSQRRPGRVHRRHAVRAGLRGGCRGAGGRRDRRAAARRARCGSGDGDPGRAHLLDRALGVAGARARRTWSARAAPRPE